MRIILGCGYVGARLARQCRESGQSVLGVVRSAAGMERLRALDIEAQCCDLEDFDACTLPLQGAEVFHFVPPIGEGREDPGTRRMVDSFARIGDPQRIVYISTTGVYGDCQGDWIDETQPVNPGADRSWRRWDAEQALRHWHESTGGELVILRVAGIYGPRRLPLERIRQGVPMVRPEEAPYSNRIHVDDLVNVCDAAMQRGRDGAVYNVSDGAPSTMAEYFRAVADAAGLPRAPEITFAEASSRLSPAMLSYLAESRRLDNRRMCEELAVKLRYPVLDEGLRACVAETS